MILALFILKLLLQIHLNIQMFELQRKRASFNRQALSHQLYGGKDKYQYNQKIYQLLDNDPVLKFNPSFLHQSRGDMMTAYAKKILRFHDFYPLDGTNEEVKSNVFTHAIPLSLHGLMFIPTLQNLCDKQQQKLFLEPAIRGEILGCYCQTELAHGSDVQNLLTTATYDPSNETFIINTPEVGAAKWWVGDLGLYCTHAAVYAQLIINKRRHGVHAFLVPIRDPKTLKVLQGIEAGDIGPKSAFSIKDNGYAIFNNFRIPRRNMLMKYHTVSKEGVYAIQGDEKISYATMLLTRSGITKILANSSSKMATIATRYSLVRTQFKNSKGEEVPVLNYQTQQEKIIPRIAETYAAWFTAKNVNELSNFVFMESKQGRFDRLNEAHILTSCLKAVLSYDVLRGSEILRRSAGGHGFHMYNGMIAVQSEATPLFTLEGQFTILLLQVGRFLIKSLKQLQKGKPIAQSAKYLENIAKEDLSVPIKDEQSLNCPFFIQKILRYHSCSKLKALATKFAQLQNQKLTQKEIEDHHAGMLISQAAIAHGYVMIYSYFLKELQAATDPQVKAVLRKLLILYGVEKITERAARFYETATITPECFGVIYRKRQALFEQLRPECLSLVEAFGYNDTILMSAIGASNGKPYENLIEWAEKHNSLNKKENRDQIISTIKKAKTELRPRL